LLQKTLPYLEFFISLGNFSISAPQNAHLHFIFVVFAFAWHSLEQ
jgi:hypothetical protein